LIVDTSPVTNITAALLPEQNSTSVRVTWDYISIPTLGSDIEILCEPECLGTWVMDRARTEIVSHLTQGKSYAFKVAVRYKRIPTVSNLSNPVTLGIL